MRIDAPTVFLVGLDERLGGLCFSYFDEVGVRIVAIRTVAAACERITKVLPTVVVVTANLSADEQQQLDDHAAAAGSEIAMLTESLTDATARTELSIALRRAQTRGRSKA